MANETLQQANMFTGDWETKRTRTPPPKQTSMFTLRETFEFGAKAHPKFAEGGTPSLQLVREDVRTPDEIECDLMREAEKLTQPMFASEQLQEVSEKSTCIDADDEQEQEHSENLTGKEEVTKLSCYLALVSVAHEKTVTLWVDSTYRRRFNIQLPQAMVAAQAAGLTAAEIDAAIQIGEFKGNQERGMMPIIYDSVPETDNASTIEHSMVTTARSASHEGFRARLRRENTQVRTRFPFLSLVERFEKLGDKRMTTTLLALAEHGSTKSLMEQLELPKSHVHYLRRTAHDALKKAYQCRSA